MNVTCLLCGHELEAFHVFPRKALFTKPLRAPIPEAVADMGIAWCGTCRHISSRLVGQMSLEDAHARTYSELYRSYAPTGLSGLQLRYTDFIALWIARWLDPGSRVLEIGCHDGYMLKLLADVGHRCEGVEPSPYADHARERYGLSVVKDFYRSDMFRPDSFDAVIVRHVVEHVNDPVGFLRDAVRPLKSGGLCYVEVPNSQWSLEAAYFPEFHVDHISYFTLPSLLQLLRLAGVGDVRHAEAFQAYMRFPFLSAMSRKTLGRPPAVDAGWVLDFGVEAAMRRFQEKFAGYVERLRGLRGTEPLAVWGAGSIGIQYAIDAGWGADEAVYVDVNPVNQGLVLSVTGQRIEKPEILREHPGDRLLIASGWEEDVKLQAAAYVRPGIRMLAFADLAGGLH